MKLMVVFGAGAVGKMTVGQELMKTTDFRLFHNHMSIDLVIEVFGNRVLSVDKRIRDAIFEEFAQSDRFGLIFTCVWAFDQQNDWDFLDHYLNIFREVNAELYFVELVASKEIRMQRNITENRLYHKVSKRDTELSNQRLIDNDVKFRYISYDGEIPFDNYIKIDNSFLEPDVVARMIKERFSL